ncbi:OsmC family protein [Rhizobium sp. SL42]|uniref:OsmC family protein n=1 Tax=Rhizobium sp. SL42 TaxID=2806346 RepID=UPI001F3A9D63|nr:OsmC family protein [Rhizobium sp. SL42]UJW74997.1 OsmC family protein [Rhizobium sp. SL42]
MSGLKTRPVGATATLGRTGYPHLVSDTGGTLEIATGASQPGFNPIDLLHAALAACLTMSARIAVRELGLADSLSEVVARVTGDKAKDGPSRIARFHVNMHFKGTLTPQQQSAVVHRAEEICTVSNSLASRPVIEIGEF